MGDDIEQPQNIIPSSSEFSPFISYYRTLPPIMQTSFHGCVSPTKYHLPSFPLLRLRIQTMDEPSTTSSYKRRIIQAQNMNEIYTCTKSYKYKVFERKTSYFHLISAIIQASAQSEFSNECFFTAPREFSGTERYIRHERHEVFSQSVRFTLSVNGWNCSLDPGSAWDSRVLDTRRTIMYPGWWGPRVL